MPAGLPEIDEMLARISSALLSVAVVMRVIASAGVSDWSPHLRVLSAPEPSPSWTGKKSCQARKPIWMKAAHTAAAAMLLGGFRVVVGSAVTMDTACCWADWNRKKRSLFKRSFPQMSATTWRRSKKIESHSHTVGVAFILHICLRISAFSPAAVVPQASAIEGIAELEERQSRLRRLSNTSEIQTIAPRQTFCAARSSPGSSQASSMTATLKKQAGSDCESHCESLRASCSRYLRTLGHMLHLRCFARLSCSRLDIASSAKLSASRRENSSSRRCMVFAIKVDIGKSKTVFPLL
mmetsp:Transcript_17799/g.53575  ORF Transcript_17799/g.53575 Transcript_17799/m.53575 type:complete len:295 (+) Transcript_17799:22-906(+)